MSSIKNLTFDVKNALIDLPNGTTLTTIGDIMIIKSYDKADVFIYENASQVVIHRNGIPYAKELNLNWLDLGENAQVIITWVDGDKHYALPIFNVAYVCNNEGKTLEKVFVECATNELNKQV